MNVVDNWVCSAPAQADKVFHAGILMDLGVIAAEKGKVGLGQRLLRPLVPLLKRTPNASQVCQPCVLNK
jgi:hypothetical protein